MMLILMPISSTKVRKNKFKRGVKVNSLLCSEEAELKCILLSISKDYIVNHLVLISSGKS